MPQRRISAKGPLPAMDALAVIAPSSPCVFVLPSAEFLGKSDEKPFRPTDVAEPIRVLIPDDFADEFGTARAQPFKRVVDVINGEHDAEVAERVDRGIPVIRDDTGREEAGEFEPAMAIRRAHHGNLDMLIAEPGDTPGPFSFDRRPPFEREAEFGKEIDRHAEIFDDDSYIVHSLERHVSNLQDVVSIKEMTDEAPENRHCPAVFFRRRSAAQSDRDCNQKQSEAGHRDSCIERPAT